MGEITKSLLNNRLILFIIIIAAFLRFYRLSELMPFIGDQGWFYLSARDMLLRGDIPLVGITSSHTWLHQGALWTYILGALFLIFRFDPLVPGYFTALIGVLTVFVVYKVGERMFSKRIGLIASVLSASFPLAVIHARLPYHTTLAPLFATLFLYFVYKWVRGDEGNVPWIIVILAILYHTQLATLVFWFVFLFFLFFGLRRKLNWARRAFKKDIILKSSVGFLIVMLPILLYDINHKFLQTFGLALWIPYRLVKVTYSIIADQSVTGSSGSFWDFLVVYTPRFLFFPNVVFAFLIFFLGLGIFLIVVSKKLKDIATLTLFFCFVISFGGFLVNHTPSEPYLLMFFPMIGLILACAFDWLMQLAKLRLLCVCVLIIMVALNSYTLIQSDYIMGKPYGYGPTMTDRINTANKIVSFANGKKYNLVGKGHGSQFESYTMNYEYLLWWLGNAPSKNPELLVFTVEDTSGNVAVIQSLRKL